MQAPAHPAVMITWSTGNYFLLACNYCRLYKKPCATSNHNC